MEKTSRNSQTQGAPPSRAGFARWSLFAPRSGHPIDPNAIISIRWLGLAGQLAAAGLVYLILDFDLPLLEVLAVIAIGALMNLWQIYFRRPDSDMPLYLMLALGFDVVQLAALLYLTGGLVNPFAVLFLAPVVVSAAVLDLRATLILLGLVIIAASLLVFFHLPLPWSGPGLVLPGLFVLGIWTALLVASVFMGFYVFWLASAARANSAALGATRLILAEEQRITSLGALATAAAHKLGSPLNTLALIAHELNRDLDRNDPHFEDIQLLGSELERCRVILSELDAEASRANSPAEVAMPLSHMVRNMLARRQPDLSQETRIDLRAARAPDGLPDNKLPEPACIELPELRYALDTLLDNAGDFARQLIVLELDWTEHEIILLVRDDGPGFRPAMLAAAGQPGQSTRKGQNAHRGLGLFLVRTFMRQLGGQARFYNSQQGGAVVELRLPRQRLQAVPRTS